MNVGQLAAADRVLGEVDLHEDELVRASSSFARMQRAQGSVV